MRTNSGVARYGVRRQSGATTALSRARRKGRLPTVESGVALRLPPHSIMVSGRSHGIGISSKLFPLLPLLLLLLAYPATTTAADWPTDRHDFQRTAATTETLAFPLTESWRHEPPQGFSPAYPAEARADEYAVTGPLKPRYTFDHGHGVAVAGGRVFVGSTTAHSLTCLDAATGKTLWKNYADAAIRLTPTVAAGRVYAGADDGAVYCWTAADGTLLWKISAAEKPRRLIPNDGRLVSPWPVRTGVVVTNGIAYFGAGLFPSEGAFLCAADAATGKISSPAHWRKALPETAIPVGTLALDDDRLIVPGGRANPIAFTRATGAVAQTFDDNNAMGTFVMASAGRIFFGPASRRSMWQITEAQRDVKKNLAQHKDVLELVVAGPRLVLVLEKELRCLDLTTRAVQWKTPSTTALCCIATANAVITGGPGEVTAHSLTDGAPLWKAAISGQATSLAVSDGRLFISTDRGALIVFASPVQPPAP